MTIMMVVIGAMRHELALGIWLLLGATGIAFCLLSLRWKCPKRD